MNFIGFAKKSRKLMGCLFILSFILITVFLINLKKNRALGNSSFDKNCVSIRIEEGDTLWSIAEQFYVPECGSMKEYIKEIKKTNSLHSDLIHSGNYLLIPYYILTE